MLTVKNPTTVVYPTNAPDFFKDLGSKGRDAIWLNIRFRLQDQCQVQGYSIMFGAALKLEIQLVSVGY